MAIAFILFLNLANIRIFIPKCTKEGGGGMSTGLRNIPKKRTIFLVLPYGLFPLLFDDANIFF